ncbi:MAG TPA: hypothetical protein VHI54_08350 [Actinomycetota bacterium]|nr:hypothetical protein [Actinomycetota bacterium]
MAADQDTPGEERRKSVEQQVSTLLGYLQTPIKQMQNWVDSGQLQSTIDNLQERAERAQEGVERGLRALNEVRQGVQTHLKKQIEDYEREKTERRERLEAAIAQVLSPPAESPQTSSSEGSAPPKAKGSSRKKPRGKKSSGKSSGRQQ